MYRRCLQEFEHDSELAMIRRPRFTPAKQSEALWDFKTKVNLLNGISRARSVEIITHRPTMGSFLNSGTY